MSSKTSQNEIKNFVVFILLAIIAYFIFFYDDNGGNDKTLYRKNPATQINDLNRQSVKRMIKIYLNQELEEL